jgi:hypothetical protein
MLLLVKRLGHGQFLWLDSDKPTGMISPDSEASTIKLRSSTTLYSNNLTLEPAVDGKRKDKDRVCHFYHLENMIFCQQTCTRRSEIIISLTARRASPLLYVGDSAFEKEVETWWHLNIPSSAFDSAQLSDVSSVDWIKLEHNFNARKLLHSNSIKTSIISTIKGELMPPWRPRTGLPVRAVIGIVAGDCHTRCVVWPRKQHTFSVLIDQSIQGHIDSSMTNTIPLISHWSMDVSPNYRLQCSVLTDKSCC